MTFNVRLSPTRFYGLVDLLQDVDPEKVFGLTLAHLDTQVAELEGHVFPLAEANHALLREAEVTTRFRENPFDSHMEKEGGDPLARLRDSQSGNFIGLIYDLVGGVLEGFRELRRVMHMIAPLEVHIPQEARVGAFPRTTDEIQTLTYQLQMYAPALQQYVEGIFRVEDAPSRVVALGRMLSEKLFGYHRILLNRHQEEGIQIHGDPITTDVAMAIFENTDSAGEIQGGTSPDEISAFSLQRAVTIAKSTQIGLVGEFLEHPEFLIEFLTHNLKVLWEQASNFASYSSEIASDIRQKLGMSPGQTQVLSNSEFERALYTLSTLDPREIKYREKSGMLTQEERKRLEHKNETLAEMVSQLKAGADPYELVGWILSRKKDLRDWEIDRNSFFVCRIGSGNAFTGESPGALEVVPGSAPSVDLNDVIGNGFAEVRAFIGSIGHASKFHDLFVATSPSKKVDKNNVLLIGPQGCGKTQILRAVASSPGSIGIFAQASDFLTCWKGEAEKNPKRLFEAGVRLHRDSQGKPVYFLIDEIDTVLNGDRGQMAFGGTNLATEFQVLMDGITEYRHLAVWGATNHPDRIPMPLIRRFAKVLVVGELEQSHREALLRQFVGYLPLHPEFDDSAFVLAAKALDGAVGDIMRKVADHLWRAKMSRFVDENPEQAELLVKHLTEDGKEPFDVAKFTPERRELFKAKLKPHVSVTPLDLKEAVQYHLNNVAIKEEIRTAKETYERARTYLAGINAR